MEATGLSCPGFFGELRESSKVNLWEPICIPNTDTLLLSLDSPLLDNELLNLCNGA